MGLGDGQRREEWNEEVKGNGGKKSVPDFRLSFTVVRNPPLTKVDSDMAQ